MLLYLMVMICGANVIIPRVKESSMTDVLAVKKRQKDNDLRLKFEMLKSRQSGMDKKNITAVINKAKPILDNTEDKPNPDFKGNEAKRNKIYESNKLYLKLGMLVWAVACGLWTFCIIRGYMKEKRYISLLKTRYDKQAEAMIKNAMETKKENKEKIPKKQTDAEHGIKDGKSTVSKISENSMINDETKSKEASDYSKAVPIVKPHIPKKKPEVPIPPTPVKPAPIKSMKKTQEYHSSIQGPVFHAYDNVIVEQSIQGTTSKEIGNVEKKQSKEGIEKEQPNEPIEKIPIDSKEKIPTNEKPEKKIPTYDFAQSASEKENKDKLGSTKLEISTRRQAQADLKQEDKKLANKASKEEVKNLFDEIKRTAREKRKHKK